MTRSDGSMGVGRVVTMLQTGIGVDNEGMSYNDLTRLERDITAMVKAGQMTADAAFGLAREVRRQLTEQGLQRFDDYVNGKVARDNLVNIVDGAADGRSGSQLEQRMSGRAARAVVAIRDFVGPPDGLLDARARVTEHEERGRIDALGAAQIRQAIDVRLAEELAAGGLRIAPPPAVWEAFQGRSADNEARRNMAERAVQGVQPRDVLLRPQEFTPVLRATLAGGQIPLREIGALSAEAAEAQRRGQLTPAERASVAQAIDDNLRNAQGVLDPSAAVNREAAVAAATVDSPVRRVLGAELVAPSVSASANQSASGSASANPSARATASRAPAASDGAQERTFQFSDPELARGFVRTLTHPSVPQSQRVAACEAVLQRGAVSLGELRAFQIGMDDAVAARLVTAHEAQQAWRVLATQAASYVGGSSVGAAQLANELAATGVRRFRG